MAFHRYATTVVFDGYRAVVIDGDLHIFRIACHGLVNGVIHDLIDQVVKASRGGIPDIHTGPFADMFEVR
jgi:hypothetical protein